MRAKQRGVACIGCLLGAVIVIGLAIGGVRIVKAYIQNAEIRHVLQAMAQDMELQNASDDQIRVSFARRSSVSEIDAVHPDDVQVSRVNGLLQLSADYTVKIPVAGNINIMLQFNPSSAKQ